MLISVCTMNFVSVNLSLRVFLEIPAPTDNYLEVPVSMKCESFDTLKFQL